MTKLLSDIYKTHYSMSMNPEYMADWAASVAKHIESAINEGQFPILVYRGMSGIASATAISLMLSPAYRGRISMMYVRKKKEKSHGSYIELSDVNNSDNCKPLWIICDDFISSSNTVLEILKAISTYFSMEIGPDTVRYALSLTPEYSDVAGKLNVLDDSIWHPNALKARKSMRRKYANFWETETKRIADSKAKQTIAIEELLNISGFKIADTVRIPQLDLLPLVA